MTGFCMKSDDWFLYEIQQRCEKSYNICRIEIQGCFSTGNYMFKVNNRNTKKGVKYVQS